MSLAGMSSDMTAIKKGPAYAGPFLSDPIPLWGSGEVGRYRT